MKKKIPVCLKRYSNFRPIYNSVTYVKIRELDIKAHTKKNKHAIIKLICKINAGSTRKLALSNLKIFIKIACKRNVVLLKLFNESKEKSIILLCFKKLQRNKNGNFTKYSEFN